MPVYTVHQPPLRPDETAVDPDRFVFVREGFAFWAFLLAPLWLLVKRLWLALLIYVVAMAVLVFALRFAGIAAGPRFLVLFLVSLLFGLEAATVHRWTLARRKWTQAGVVVADRLDEAERRFFAGWVERAPVAAPVMPATPAASPAPMMRAVAPSSYPIGVFPEPGEPAVTVAIIDYGSGNLHSAAKAFERAAHDRGAGDTIIVTRDPDAVARADRIVLPGVGAFADCRAGLDAIDGMVSALDRAVREKARPFFGICVGMQLMAERGNEYRVTPGLGWIAGEVNRIKPNDPSLKIPHMGWNTLDRKRTHPLLAGIPDTLHAYFVHSYALDAARAEDVIAQADYGGPVTAIVGRDTMVGTQFHPEKSQRMGLALIANFLTWSP